MHGPTPVTAPDAPDAAVVVATRDRPIRLRWLLDALAEQTAAERLEVVVAHDSRGPETERLLRTHRLRERGRLSHLTFAARTLQAAAKRDAGWRAASAPLILFTDDDCRPAPDWVERVLAAARAHPGAVLQGATQPDPDEAAVLRGAPWAQSQTVDPPTVWAETCNIAYPRALLERIGGFDPRLAVGEDTDLAWRARAEGAPLLAVPGMLVHHAVHAPWLPARLRSLGRWGDMPAVVRRHPALRRSVCARVFYKPEHAALCAAALAPALGRRSALAWGLALPWLALSLRHRGAGPRGVVRSLSELPGRAAIDIWETAVLARGSVRHRTLLL
jgi:hypothetical protein